MSFLYSFPAVVLYSQSLEILSNIPLAPFTTFGIGGPARWFAEVTSEEEIVEAVDWARQNGAPLFVLGGGSNLLVSDAGFDGLVIRMALRGISAHSSVSHAHSIAAPVDLVAAFFYQCAAGEPWENVVQRTLEDQCAGLECLTGIPGTVGGTPVQNVGAYGQEVSSVIQCVRVYDSYDRAFVDLTAFECNFSYRRSRFNSPQQTSDRGRFIVTRVDFQLNPTGEPTLQYPDLVRELESTLPAGKRPSLADTAAAVRRIRRSKGMLIVEGDPESRSAGSFFKNPIITEKHFQRIAAQTPTPPSKYPADPGPNGEPSVKIPAAWLIEQAGFSKGYTLGTAAISPRHTLALINKSSATAADIVALAEQIAAAVEARFGIHLEMEPVQVGF